MPAPRLGRDLHALAWPEKVAASFALYRSPFEVHDQHVFYPSPIQHPLAYHPHHRAQLWPMTDGTFGIAEQLGLAKWHPKAWEALAPQKPATDRLADPEGPDGRWVIGAWLGDFLLYLNESSPLAYILFWSVKKDAADQGKPGGRLMRRLSARAIEREQVRGQVCAAYAEQLGSRVVEFNLNDVPRTLQTNMVCLCRAQPAKVDLPRTAATELSQAFAEGVGKDIPARDIARQLLSASDELAQAKSLLEIAVWERSVRVDLHQPVLWNRPLLPERIDLLVEFAHLYRK